MGVSFKVSKRGTRYRPKQLQIEDDDDGNGSVSESQQRVGQVMIKYLVFINQNPLMKYQCVLNGLFIYFYFF